MRLNAAARHFDTTTCVDAFDASRCFLGQLNVYDDSTRDGATVQRRVLSVDPCVTLPSRRVVTISGEQWLVGAHEVDMFFGKPLRIKYVMHKAEGPCQIGSAAQVLTSGTVASYAARIWVKDMKALESSSNLTSFYNVFLPSVETVSRGGVIIINGQYNVVRNTFLSAAGFRIAECDALEAAAVESANFSPRAHDPLTDTYVAGAPVELNALRFRFQDNYVYAAESSEKFVNGDIRAMVAASLVTPKTGDKLALSDGDWYVIAAALEQDSWNLHLRRKPA